MRYMFPEIANTVSTPYGPRACSEWITSASRLESTLPDVATMVIFVVLDCLLKISATESKLLVQYDRDRETVWRASPTPCDNDNEHFSIDGQVDDADAELIPAWAHGICILSHASCIKSRGIR